MKRITRWIIYLGLAAGLVAAGVLGYANQPLTLSRVPTLVHVPPGTHLKRLGVILERDGMIPSGEAFWLLGRLLGKGAGLKAGVYAIDRPVTPLELLEKIERGDVYQGVVRLIEGRNWREIQAVLAAQPLLVNDSADMGNLELMRAIGASERRIEGLLFPDTYFFAPHTSDIEVLRRAYALQQRKLMAAWEKRAPGLPYRTPYEALIMASIVEKETGAAFERPQIAGVFINRLRLGMRLQTDPTVIYGLGERFDGNLRKVDLQTDTPYNTYTRAGLPPTPIAMPSEAAIQAALNPAQTDALYFVSRGDGTHVFSSTLEQHNRAVNRYQRR